MIGDSLTFYRQLAKLRWPKSYLAKFLLVAFVGVHVPLLSILLYLVFANNRWATAFPILIVSLISTLSGSLITMFIQRQLLAPVSQTAEALQRYFQKGVIPQLPVAFSDEAGQLMANAQHCLISLDQLLKLRSDMLAIMAHDLRSPLMTITVASELMTKTLEQTHTDTPPLQKYIHRIQNAAQAQLNLINDTLNLMLAESGKIAVQPSEIELTQLLKYVFTETQLLADNKGVTYQLVQPIASETKIQVDIPKTHQVLTNLVNNAIKFTPSGGQIELSASTDQHTIAFYVKDSGRGMDATSLRHLFEPFSRAQRPGTGQEKGYGLGLWICKTFTEAQGGAITVESQVGQGSCFTVRLPHCVLG